MWYSASIALLVVTLLPVSTAGHKKRERNATEIRPYARILESRVLPSGALRIVVPYEDTFIRNGRRVARVRPYYCKKKILEVNAGREFYTMGYCRPIVWYRRTTKQRTTMPPTTSEPPIEVTTVSGATAEITDAIPADLTTGPALEITTNSPAMSTTTSSAQTTETSATTTPRVSTESFTTTATEESRGDVTTSAATESMTTTTTTTTITMLDSTTSAAPATAAAAFKSEVKIAARTKDH